MFDEALSGIDMSGKGNSSTAPRAFLNYIFFDQEMNYVRAGFLKITTAAQRVGVYETISLNDIVADREGYILAYLSNENQEAVNVHFDDFMVYHGKTNVVSTQDYYPFGLIFGSYQRTASTPNNYKFNGKELDSNTGWHQYGTRHYDASIARWIQIDPVGDLMHEWSPYNYNYNNPVNYIDPDGAIPWPIRKWFIKSGFRKATPDGVFGERRIGYRPSYTHRGIDLNFSGGGDTDRGAAILSTHGGKVIEVRKFNTHKNSAGTYVKIQGPNGNIQTVYMHLDEVSVEEGDQVTEGQVIGKMGGSGFGKKDAHTSHLHFEIIVKDADGKFQQIDPWAGGDQPVDAQVLIDRGASVENIVSSLDSQSKSLSNHIGSQEKRLARREAKGKDTSRLKGRISRNKKLLEQTNNVRDALSGLL
ncbi:MAG: RHS repeat-associated core domain-containing protein [Bacteroidota bacterium]